MPLGIDHIGHAVTDLDAAVAAYQRLYGLEVAHRYESETDGVREAMLPIGSSFIQLLEPTRSSSPVARFLERRGPGLHHIAFAVDSVAGTLGHLDREGARLVDTQPRVGTGGLTLAFVHPQTTLGALVELVEHTPSGDTSHS